MLQSITSRMPELGKLEKQVSELEAEVRAAQTKVDALRTRVLETREDDIGRAAAALNRGRSAPSPKEPEVRAQLENAAYEQEVLARRLQLAQSDLSSFVQEHRLEIAHHLHTVHAEQSRAVSEGAAEVLTNLLELYRTEDEGRQLARTYPEPVEEEVGEAASLTTIWPLQTTQNFGGGPMRGEVQGILEYLRSLGGETVVEEVASGASKSSKAGGGG